MKNSRDANHTTKANERIMVMRLLSAAEQFYQDPKNVEAFEAWKKGRKQNA